jgi:hypothetical protein
MSLLLKEGDCVQNPLRVTVDERAERIHNDPMQFININCAAIMFFLKYRVNVLPVVETN